MSSPPLITNSPTDAQDVSPKQTSSALSTSPSQQLQPITLSPESRKDRKSKLKDSDLSASSPSSGSTRQRASSNGSATSTGSHRHHHHHTKGSKSSKDKSKEQAEDAEIGESNNDDADSTRRSSRRHRHHSKGPEDSDSNNTNDNDNNDNNSNSDPEEGTESAEPTETKEKSKSKDSTRKRSSSNRILPSSAVQTGDSGSQLSQPKQPIAVSNLATTSFTLGSVGNGVNLSSSTNGTVSNTNGIIKSGVLAMKMDQDDGDNESADTITAEAPALASRNMMWHEGHFILYQDGTFDEHVDESSETVIFSGTIRSIRRMDDTNGAAKEVILNETRYTHFVKVLLAVPSGQGMIRQVVAALGMRTEAELSAWVATFEACDTYILKPIKPVGSSSSTLSTLSTAKSKREAKSEWAIKKSESSQLNFTVTKRGWVKYRGVMKQWSLRLFVLKPPMLIYYKDEIDESKEAASGIINLHNCSVVKRESKKDGFCFKIRGMNEKHSIYASRGLKGEMLTSKIGINPSNAILRVVTQEEGLEWIHAIEEAITYSNFCQDGTFTKVISPNTLTCSGGGSESSFVASSSPTTALRASSSTSPLNVAPRENTVVVQTSPSTSPSSFVQEPQGKSATSLGESGGEKDEKSKKRKHKKQSGGAATTTADSEVKATTTTTVTYTEKDVEELVSFQSLKFLEPKPTNYAVEIPREEMKIDAFEQGKGIIMGLMKQVKPGMDLTKVTLPTHILEPRSFLEKMTDYFTHIELLSK